MISDVSGSCSFCGINCVSFTQCKKQAQWNLIVEDAKRMNELKKHIKLSATKYTGSLKWFNNDISDSFVEIPFDTSTNYQYRFMTITFDPKKFTLNQLSQPKLLINYFFNCIYDLRNLFKEKPIIVIEYHKSGIPHFHMNYSVDGVLELNSLILRMKYYFSKDLRTKNAIHDRIFNSNGIAYMQKANKTYFTLKNL